MKQIAFFETTKTEETYLRQRLAKTYRLQFFREPIQKVPAAEFSRAEIISVFIYSTINKELIATLKRLSLIAARSTGFNHINVKEARRRRVTVVNVPYYGENTVAEHTFALILSLSRNIHKAFVRTSRNDFSLRGLQGFDLKGRTIGVIGAGSIGLHVIRMAKGFGMKVIVADPQRNHFLSETLDFTYMPLDVLLKTADIITLHCPLNDHTHHLINMTNIHSVKPGALFINTARGAIIETQALYYALHTGLFAGAGLDVFEGEELMLEENQMLSRNVPVEKLRTALEKSLLMKMENVILTPHMGFDSIEAVERILQTTVENILAFDQGTPQYAVTSE